MNIVFFGTPEFAIPSLKILFESKHSVKAVVTAPDKPKGRGRNLSFTPIKEFALKNNIPVLTPDKLNDEIFINQLKEINADLFIIVAFRILPKIVFSLPKRGAFNLHGSILPKYRGAAPIQWALINGEKETGLTTFFLEEKVDTGNIILTKKVEIFDDDNFGSLHDRMSLVGADLVIETINLIEKNDFHLEQQNNDLASPAPKITKEICEINWFKSAKEIHNLIRGLSPFPGAFFKLNEKIFKVFRSQISFDEKLLPAEIKQTKDKIYIGTSEGSLQILEIQAEGRKRMHTEEFLRGHSLT